jgi:predicted DNA binding CopG/RHH family protein
MEKKAASQKRLVTPDEALEFLESYKLVMQGADGPTQQISIRIPSNILSFMRVRAKSERKKYQSLIVDVLRKEILNSR